MGTVFSNRSFLARKEVGWEMEKEGHMDYTKRKRINKTTNGGRTISTNRGESFSQDLLMSPIVKEQI